MELTTGSVRRLYFRFLSAAFGSALISSIYGMVDMAMVGQYQGPDGAAALAVVAPVWNIIYSLGLLTGIGGSVLFSARRGNGNSRGAENEYFTAAVIGSAILAVLSWAWIWLFERDVLLFFGADETLLPLAQAYLKPVKCVFPVFLLTQLLTAFLRNDGRPGLATAAVLAGGIFNVFGDYFCVFTLGLGVFGAGLATAIGACVSLLVMASHFVSKKCTLRLVRVAGLFGKLRAIAVTGVSRVYSSNCQRTRTAGLFVLRCAYSVGQAAQPILSTNYGAKKPERIRQALFLALPAIFAPDAIWWAMPLTELVTSIYAAFAMRRSLASLCAD